MINFSTITKALEKILISAPSLSGYIIERSVLENADPGKCPWVGIYRKRLSYTARRMGVGASNWSNDIKLDVIVQASSQVESAEELLEGQIASVIAVIDLNRTILNTVHMILGYDIEYFIRQDATDDVFFQRAVITISMETIS